MCNNPNLDLVNMNAYIKFDEDLSVCSHDIELKQSSGVNQGPKLWYKCAKKPCNNPNLDLVNFNAYTKFGQIQLIGSQDIERKHDFDGLKDGMTDNPNPV